MSTSPAEVKGQLPLKNVARFAGLVHALTNRDPGEQGIGVWYGYSGYGKTCASIYVENRVRAVRVEMCESWSKKALLEAILEELGVQPGRMTVAAMAKTIKVRLADDPRPLIVDEADKLVEKRLVEQIREIADATLCPVILIGEERLPQKLSAIERVHNRVLQFTAAEPCDAEDTATLAAAFCPKLTIGPDLLDDVRRASDGKARRIVNNLRKVREFARNKGLSSVDRAEWGLTPFETGRIPDPRKIATFSPRGV